MIELKGCTILTSKLSGFFLSSFFWGLAFASAKLPPLLGYILSGIILGPSFLKYMGDSIEYIKVIGEFGLLMLMFLAGLELNIEEFIGIDNNWLKPVKTVALQVMCSFLLVLSIWLIPDKMLTDRSYLIMISAPIIAICVFGIYRSGRPKNENISSTILWIIAPLLLISILICIKFGLLSTNWIFNNQTMVLAGCILTLNSTAIAIKLLESREKKNTSLGSNVIGVLIGQDLVLVVMIIGLRSLSEYVSIYGLLFKVSIAIGILYIVKMLAESKPSFISNALDYIFQTSKEITALFAITLCFTFSSVAEMAGLSDIYGAFIAGLILGNVYKHNKYLIKVCEPISNILMTMFFMWIGAMFNVQDLMQHLLSISVIGIGIVIFKYWSNYYIIKTVHKENPEVTNSSIILSSLLLTQMSEFAIVMIDIVAKNVPAHDTIATSLCNLMKSSTIVSLSIGAVVTVMIKNILYRYKYLE